MFHVRLALLLSTTALIISGLAEGPGVFAAPLNDNFDNGTAVGSAPYSNTQTTATATLETNEPQPCGGIGATVWYTLTAPQAGTARVSTAGSDFDTVLAAYTGNNVGSLALLACNDDTASAGPSVVQFTTATGGIYRIQAGGYFGAEGSLSISLSYDNPPANDHFSNAVAVSALPFSDSLNTRVATTEPSEPLVSCDPATVGRSVWYSYTSPQPRLIKVTTAGSSFDTVLAVYTGNSLSTLIKVACNDDAGEVVTTSSIEFVANAGTTYRLQAAGFQGDSGDLAFNIGVSTTDTDGDGYTDNNEMFFIGTGAGDPCGNDGWPSDLFAGGFQANTLNIQDLGTFITPVRRIGASPGDPGFHARWDLVPGSVVGTDIGITDVAATVTGASGYPPMFGNQKAFGRACPFPP